MNESEFCAQCGRGLTPTEDEFCSSCSAELEERGEEAMSEDELEPAEITPEEQEEMDAFQQERLEEEERQQASENAEPEEEPESKETASERLSGMRSRAERAVANAQATASRLGWAAKSFVTVVTNPVTWIAALVVIVLFAVTNVATTTYQTVGSIAVDGQETGQGVANGLLARLAQRGVLLSQQAYKYPNSDAFVAAHGGDPGRTNANPWRAACPDVVNIIYGLPPLYIGNNGIVNAYQNFQRLKAGGLQAQSWWFPNDSSPGAKQMEPPAGAIVQSTGTGPAGHTYVVLTDDLKVIDNTWNVHAGGPATGVGYRILDERSKAGIRGWFVPPAEGYQGTFLDDDPMLPAVPDWAQGDASDLGDSGSGVGATVPAGDAQKIAQKLVKEKGWSDADFTCLVKLWTKESSWNVSANNASSGAYGIPQALPGNKMATEGSDWKTNPETQIKWGLKYIQGRYVTPCGAWGHSQQMNWY